MIGFKGRLIFIQFMPQKPTKWGLKAYVLADSTTGYMYNWILYTGICIDKYRDDCGSSTASGGATQRSRSL